MTEERPVGATTGEVDVSSRRPAKALAPPRARPAPHDPCGARLPQTAYYLRLDRSGIALHNAARHEHGRAPRCRYGPLYKANNPAASPAEVKAALIAACEPGPIPEDPDTFPEGVVNVSTF